MKSICKKEEDCFALYHDGLVRVCGPGVGEPCPSIMITTIWQPMKNAYSHHITEAREV